MHTSTSRLGFIAIASVALLTATNAFAETRSATPSLQSTSSSKSSSKSTTSAPAAVINSSIKASELPYCGGTKEDKALLWDSTAKKWVCKALSALLPPKCDAKDVALRFDGKAWKCETIGGLLVAHSVVRNSVKGKYTCDTENTWGGATCTLGDDGMTAKLKCPFNTLQVTSNALSGYISKGGAGYDEFGGEYHAYCYSKPITIAK